MLVWIYRNEENGIECISDIYPDGFDKLIYTDYYCSGYIYVGY